MQTCELLIRTTEGQKIVAIILFDGKNIAGMSMDGYGALLREVLDETIYIDGKEISKEDDSKTWFNALPMKYSGSYLRAAIE